LADVGLSVAGHLGLLSEAILSEEPRGRHGNYVYGTFGRDFVTQDDRRVMVLALTARQWHSLGQATGLTEQFHAIEVAGQLDLRQEEDRWRARDEISRLLEPWIRQRPLGAVRETLESQGVLWGPYQTFKELVTNDPRASTANPMFEEVDEPGLGRHLIGRSPLRFSATATAPARSAPLLGEHTDEVIEELGLAN
ncbi:MAG: CoA transferase, partial [Candidatus Dormibacteraceae bacterium]